MNTNDLFYNSENFTESEEMLAQSIVCFLTDFELSWCPLSEANKCDLESLNNAIQEVIKELEKKAKRNAELIRLRYFTESGIMSYAELSKEVGLSKEYMRYELFKKDGNLHRWLSKNYKPILKCIFKLRYLERVVSEQSYIISEMAKKIESLECNLKETNRKCNDLLEYIKNNHVGDLATYAGWDEVYLSDLNLNTRSFNALHRAKVYTVADLVEVLKTSREIRNLGEKSREHLKEILKELGIVIE